jgi:Zn-dependent peptidase ImmA (M78 family)
VKISLPKTIRVVDRKLGREQAMGMAHYGQIPLVELDSRLKAKERLGTLVHELIHIVFEDLTEEQVISVEQRIASVLWADGWRRIQK